MILETLRAWTWPSVSNRWNHHPLHTQSTESWWMKIPFDGRENHCQPCVFAVGSTTRHQSACLAVFESTVVFDDQQPCHEMSKDVREFAQSVKTLHRVSMTNSSGSMVAASWWLEHTQWHYFHHFWRSQFGSTWFGLTWQESCGTASSGRESSRS